MHWDHILFSREGNWYAGDRRKLICWWFGKQQIRFYFVSLGLYANERDAKFWWKANFLPSKGISRLFDNDARAPGEISKARTMHNALRLIAIYAPFDIWARFLRMFRSYLKETWNVLSSCTITIGGTIILAKTQFSYIPFTDTWIITVVNASGFKVL